MALAIPVTLALTLAVFYLYGYTLNRITLFALIFSIGILVDDAIVVVENIVRHFRLPENRERSQTQSGHRSGGRSGQPDDPGHPDGNRRHLAHGLCRRTDGALYAAHSGGRLGRHGFFPAGGIYCHTLGFLAVDSTPPKKAQTDHVHGADPESEDWATRLYRRVMNPLHP